MICVTVENGKQLFLNPRYIVAMHKSTSLDNKEGTTIHLKEDAAFRVAFLEFANKFEVLEDVWSVRAMILEFYGRDEE